MFDRRTHIKRFVFLLLAVMLNSFAAQAQFALSAPEKMDSLKVVLKNAKNDRERFEAYMQLANACDIQDNLKYAGPAVAIIDKNLPKTKNKEEIGHMLNGRMEAVNIIVFYYSQLHKNDTSAILKQYKQHLSISRKYNNSRGMSRAYLALSDQYASWGQPIKKLHYLRQGYATMKKYDDKKSESKFILQLAFLYAEFGDTTKAVEYIHEAEELEKKIGDSTRISGGYYLRGRFYYDMKRYDMALLNYSKAEERFKRVADTSQLLQLYHEMGRTFLKKGEYEQALKYYTSQLAIAKAKGVEPSMAIAEVAIGDVYSLQKKYDLAIVQHKKLFDFYKKKGIVDAEGFVGGHLAQDYFMMGDYAKARPLAYHVLALSYKRGFFPDAIEGEQMVYKVDSALGNYKSAFEHYLKFLELTNKLNKEAIHKASIQESFQKDLALQKADALKEQARKDAVNAAEKRQQKYIIYSVSIVLLLVAVLAVFILRGYRQKQKANKELAIKNDTIVQQKHLVEEKQKEIIESINYAKYLQEAILPPQQFIDENIPENFVLYKPKDIVAGDFYWAEKKGDLFFIAAADSTGHGVPGAMVSVVCSNALNRTVNEFNLVDTGKILDKTRELVLETFAKSSSEVKDGMDISLLCIDLKSRDIYWSGANNSLWFIQNGTLNEIKPDKQPIGRTDSPRPFVSHKVDCGKNTIFYLFTDGYADQFGGSKGKKLKYKTMEEKLLAIHTLPMSEQQLVMDRLIEEWMGELEQNDDICLIGVKV